MTEEQKSAMLEMIDFDSKEGLGEHLLSEVKPKTKDSCVGMLGILSAMSVTAQMEYFKFLNSKPNIEDESEFFKASGILANITTAQKNALEILKILE